MACFRIFPAYYKAGVPLSFGKQIPDGKLVRVRCGRCYGCRMDRVKAWALRCQHEASCWDHNAFVTLTYDEENLPWHRGLVSRDVQLWLKRFRKKVCGVQSLPDGSRPVRFFLVGEYGEQSLRPHYHALLFNVFLPKDRQVSKQAYESDLLASTWGLGSHQVGSVTPASAAYVSGYALKKVFGSAERRAEHYGSVDVSTGEYVEREREFARMSLRPAIGSYWVDRYATDLSQGFVVNDGQKFAVPRYYRQRLRESRPVLAEKIEIARAQLSARVEADSLSEARLEAAESVAVARRELFRSSSSTRRV